MEQPTRMIDGRPCTACQVWLPCDLLKAVEERARQMGVRDNDVIKEALRAFLGIPEPSDEERGCPR